MTPDHSSLLLPNPLLEIPRNLRANPFSNRDGDAIPNHSIGIVVAPRERECFRHSLQPRVFSNCVRPRAARKPPVRNQSRAQVFGVMRHAGGCDATSSPSLLESPSCREVAFLPRIDRTDSATLPP
jgi:hypothetical protein